MAILVAVIALTGAAIAGWVSASKTGGATPEATEAVAAGDATDQPAAPTMGTPTVEPSPNEPHAGDMRVVIRGGVAVEQVYVPAGSFMMGSEDGATDEKPVHGVTLDAFWIDRTEVTNGQYAACVTDGACRSPQANSSYTRPNYYGNPEYAGYPVIYVSWDDAVAYAAWAGGRLPTEAEWEYAAAGPVSRVYPWGDTFDGERLNVCNRNCPFDHRDDDWDDGHADTAPVGSYPSGASWVGALDLAGNVWEWVNDRYDVDYYWEGPDVNPTGPTSGEGRVLRGGSWNSDERGGRVSVRHYDSPVDALSNIGFRVVAPVGSGP